MKKIAILTDSAGNLKEDLDRGIFVVPLYVNFKDESFKDLAEITPEELYERIDEDLPQTSAPSIADFADEIERIKSLGYDQILGITMSLGLSGTFNAMRLALESSDIEFVAIDSKQVSIGEGILTLYAADLIEEGKTLEEVAEILEKKRDDVKFYAVINDLKHMIRGGRVSHIKGFIGGLLKLNPILAVGEDGHAEAVNTLRGRNRALKFVIDEVKQELKEGDKYYFALSYGKVKEQLDPIKLQLENIIEGAIDYLECPITSVLGTHGGPDAYVVSFLKL